MKWKTMFSAMFEPDAVFSNPGNDERIEYALSVGKDGRKCLREVRKYSMRDHIQSFAPGCDMAVILNKLRAGLISSDFDESNCVDLSIMPKDVVDALHNLGQFKSTFSQFPAEVQKMFSYDPNLFLNSFIDGTLPSMLQSLVNPDPQPQPEPQPDSQADPSGS